MTLFKLVGTTNEAIRPYEGKYCMITQNRATKQLRIDIFNSAVSITTSPCVDKMELGNLVVGRTENSAYFFEKVCEM